MRALRAALTLALGAGLGAAAEGWRRRRADARPAPGLLGRLPVLPVAAAAELPVVPAGPGELAKYGLPGLAQLKSRESYVLCYDPRTRCALWVVEQLRPERLRGDGDRRSCDFREDDSVHAYHRATNADYRGSGFDRGHLAAAANHRWSQKAMDDTFYLSNIAPPGAPPQPEGLEQPGEVQPELDPHLPERLCLHRAALPAQGEARHGCGFPQDQRESPLAQMSENLAGTGPKGSTSTLALTPEPDLLTRHRSCKMTITRHWSKTDALGPAGVAQ
ncbi:endonuclease G, mitochondrial isoform X2 [Myotis lucifugus]|uniref:endonuclease G, mitochondrial isoform X2 n=1 Tax=Myotis lucifugus TaxID=59463 RepID=UPI000CCC7294|nr:endonuclease G, mitochondrial isoform X2 [Myotis lucifugus]